MVLNATPNEMAEFKLVARVFGEQCRVVVCRDSGCQHHDLKEDGECGPYSARECDEILGDGDDEPPMEAEPKDPKDVSSESLQYPTDPDASYDGHKGKGYQAQIVETYTPSRDPEVKRASLNLITYVKVEGAAKSDSAALRPAVDKLDEEGLKPRELLADTSHGGHENFVHAAAKGVALAAPVPGKEGAPKAGKDAGGRDGAAEAAKADSFAREAESSLEGSADELEPPEEFLKEPFKLSDIESDGEGVIKRCPMGCEPVETRTAGAAYRACFDHAACSARPRRDGCPVTMTKRTAQLSYKPEDVISSKRRAFEKTPEFRGKYGWRSGIEGTNPLLARLGLKRLRIRGLGKVNLAVNLKALGLNIWRLMAFMRRNQGVGAMI
jgi:hypothetical protein